ncbi:hypothetical protein BH23BAC1_BH23BAC1_24580 [soil metagenome]
MGPNIRFFNFKPLWSTEWRDILIFLFVANTINYYLTYSNISFSFRTFLTYSIDYAQGVSGWLICRYIIMVLDHKMPLNMGS